METVPGPSVQTQAVTSSDDSAGDQYGNELSAYASSRELGEQFLQNAISQSPIQTTIANNTNSDCFLLPQTAMVKEDIPEGSVVIPMYLVVNKSMSNNSPQCWNNETVLSVTQQNSSNQALDINSITNIPMNRHENETAAENNGVNGPEKNKRKTWNRKKDGLKFPPCEVCTRAASGIHYGSYTCEACKNFFRRSLKRPVTEIMNPDGTKKKGMVCVMGGNCDITNQKDKIGCSACRYNKCIALGMDADKCKKGRFTYSQRTETIQRVRILEGKDAEPLPGTSGEPAVTRASSASNDTDTGGASTAAETSPSPDDGENSTTFPDEVVERLVSAMKEINFFGGGLETQEQRDAHIEKYLEEKKTRTSMFGPMDNVPTEEHNTLLKDFGIDLDGVWTAYTNSTSEWERIVGTYCNFAKEIPNFTQLSADDQIQLLKHTHCDFFVTLMHSGYHEKYNVFLDMNNIVVHVDDIADKFFSRDVIVMAAQLMTRLQQLHVTEAEMSMLMSMATMATDHCPLDNRALVDQTQATLADHLLRHLCLTHGRAAGTKRFTKFVDYLTCLRELSHQYMREYKDFCADTFVQKTFPSMTALCPDNDT